MTEISTTQALSHGLNGTTKVGGAARQPLFKRAIATARAWMAVSHQRTKLRAMDDRMLRDIGLSREDAYREAERPFWDIPKA